MSELKEIKDDVKKILEIINGNGKVGLVGKVTIMWNTILFICCGVAISLIKSFF